MLRKNSSHQWIASTLALVTFYGTLAWTSAAYATDGRKIACFVLPKNNRQGQAAAVMSSILRTEMDGLSGVVTVTGSPVGNPQAAVEASRLADAGFTSLNTGNSSGALTQFRQAWDVLSQNPGAGSTRLHARIAKGLGVATFQDGNTTRAKELIKRSLLLYRSQTANEYAYSVDIRNVYEYAKREIDEQSPGTLEVRSTPDSAEVFVDGEFKGYTTIALSDQAAGNHLIEVIKDGYLKWSTNALVSAGGRLPIDAMLTAAPNKAELDAALSRVRKSMTSTRFASGVQPLLQTVEAREALVVTASLSTSGFTLEGYYLDLAGVVNPVNATLAQDAEFYNNIKRLLVRTTGAAPKTSESVSSLGAPPKETIDSVMKQSEAVGGDIVVNPDEIFSEKKAPVESITDKWWFWTIVGVGAAAIAGAVTAIVLTQEAEEDSGAAVGNFNINLQSF